MYSLLKYMAVCNVILAQHNKYVMVYSDSAWYHFIKLPIDITYCKNQSKHDSAAEAGLREYPLIKRTHTEYLRVNRMQRPGLYRSFTRPLRGAYGLAPPRRAGQTACAIESIPQDSELTIFFWDSEFMVKSKNDDYEVRMLTMWYNQISQTPNFSGHSSCLARRSERDYGDKASP